MAFFVVSALTMLLFRKNGVYAFVFMVPVLLFFHKKHRKKMGMLLGIIFALYFLVNSSLTILLYP